MVRIRKNLKVSPLQFFPNVALEDLQPHICKLNQSPWDSSSCPFDHDSSSPLLQFEAGEGFNGNGSLGDSIAAVESVASPMDIDKAEVVAGDVIDNVDKVIMRCQKNDARSWQCKKEAKEGFLFCDHHIGRSSYNNSTSGNGNILPFNFVISKKESAAPAKTVAGTRQTRPKAVKKGPNPANPYEFYYYSGFGPKWGRKRGKKGEAAEEEEEEDDEEGNKVEAAAENVAAASASSSSANTDPQPSSPHNVGNGSQLDYMEDNFDDEDGSEEEGGPRRMRRPVKARSLMSIINVKAQE